MLLEAKMSAELVTFFKALADANRLKLVGLLAQRGYSVEELAALLDLKPPTVSHHLSKLAQAGLVTARAEGYYSIYQLDREALEAAARRLFSSEQIAAAAGNVDLDAYDRKVLANFILPDGRLKKIPAQRRKLEVVLRHVVKSFEPGVKYSEKQVNQALARLHEDTATLRRELVGYGFMKRDAGGGDYRVEEVQVQR
jgi:biotin operon repressor